MPRPVLANTQVLVTAKTVEPVVAPPPVAAPDWKKANEKLEVSAIIGSPDNYIANVNGNLVRQGQDVVVTIDGFRFVFHVRRITMKGVEFEKGDARPAP